MTQHAKCGAGHWLTFYTIPLHGLTWQRCPCGEKPVPRHMATTERPMLTCPTCGAAFVDRPYRKGGRGTGRLAYCSRTCRNAEYAKRKRLTRADAPQEQRVCENPACRQTFTCAKHLTRRSCSTICANRLVTAARHLRARRTRPNVAHMEETPR